MMNRYGLQRSGVRLGVTLCAALVVSAAGLMLPGTATAQDKSAAKITEDQAKEIALKALPGKVTKVAIEKKKGKTVYAVEIQSEKQGEKDVLVDVVSGKVIGID